MFARAGRFVCPEGPTTEQTTLAPEGRDQPLLVQLRGSHLGELAQARDHRAQMALGLRGKRNGIRVLDFRIPGDHPGIDGIGLFQPPHAFRKLTNIARVEHGHGHFLIGQMHYRPLFIAASGFHSHHLHLVFTAKLNQRSYPRSVVGESACGTGLANTHIQKRRRNIHSTNNANHGNLPCMCD
jgi:hypothetical protein